jgi:hypothetical protein
VTAPESPSALLRRAADRLDELAGAATKGPWADEASIPYGHRVGSADETDRVAWTGEHGESGSEADARYIAAMHPPAGAAFAAMLRAAAIMAKGLPEAEDVDVIRHAMDAARNILGAT